MHVPLKLAGVVAVEVTGGPTIAFHPGRKVRDESHMYSCIYAELIS